MPTAVLGGSSILTLAQAGALHVLWDDAYYSWVITPIVQSEVVREPIRSEVDQAIVEGRVRMVEVGSQSPTELSKLAHWSRLLDAGEAEAISLALSWGWQAVVEDLYAQRALTREAGIGSWINSATLLVRAVRESRMTEAEADAIFSRLHSCRGHLGRGVTSIGHLARQLVPRREAPGHAWSARR